MAYEFRDIQEVIEDLTDETLRREISAGLETPFFSRQINQVGALLKEGYICVEELLGDDFQAVAMEFEHIGTKQQPLHASSVF